MAEREWRREKNPSLNLTGKNLHMWQPRRFVGWLWVSQELPEMNEQMEAEGHPGVGVDINLAKSERLTHQAAPCQICLQFRSWKLLASIFLLEEGGCHSDFWWGIVGVLTMGVTWGSGRWRESGGLKVVGGDCIWMCEAEKNPLWC